MNNLLHDSTNITVLLGVIEVAETGRVFVKMSVCFELIVTAKFRSEGVLRV